VTGGGGTGPALVPVMDVGGTHVTAALVDLGAGAVIGSTVRRRALRPSAPAGELLESILGCGQALAAPARASWGVAVPGRSITTEGSPFRRRGQVRIALRH